VVGVANSFRMIVFERTKELGTMRAIGSQRGWLTRMIIGEALFIGVVGCFIGGLGGLAGLQVLGQLDFSGNGLVEMFLTRGRVSWYVEPVITGVVVLIVLLSGVLGALGPARTAAAVEPVVAIRNE
jgi:putative ABC transport system permease protein